MHQPGAADERGLATLARATVEEHWAVLAVAPDRRALLMERADAAIAGGGEGLGEPIADGLMLLGTAYELAALTYLDDALTREGSARELAAAILQSGASRALRCAIALRPATDEPEATTRWALRVAALATVARERPLFLDWWSRRPAVVTQVQQFSDALESATWERYALGTIWLSWLGLLGAPIGTVDPRPREPRRRPSTNGADEDALGATPTLVATRARLAAFRERRAGLVGRDEGTVLNAQGLRTRMADFAIRHLADATELLTVAVIRRTLPDVSPALRLHLAAARSALAGDHGLDLLLAWLQAAGLTLAGGVTAQLDLPGL